MTSTILLDDAVDSSIDLLAATRRVSDIARMSSIGLDRDGAFPSDEIHDLQREGLLVAPFNTMHSIGEFGTADLAALRSVLQILGSGSLALGRLYEGHINAVALVMRYGSDANLELLASEAEAGRPSGVWMAGEPLRLIRDDAGKLVLQGRKILCSGAGHVRRPLVAADHDGGSVMVIPHVEDGRADAAGWTARGMRATATGIVEFTGIVVDADEIVGTPGDYLRSPYFRGGAWRVIAVQLGGLKAILELYKEQLAASPHRDHPIQLARFGEAIIACETADLWVRRASMVAESPFEDAGEVDAYVDLARNAFESAALHVIALAQKAIGLKAFMRPNPLERIIRDLETYLRQPALDASLISAATFHLGRGQAPWA